MSNSIRIQVRINEIDDPDIYNWLVNTPEGHVSEVVRQLMRNGFYGYSLPDSDFNRIEEIARRVMLEVTSALAVPRKYFTYYPPDNGLPDSLGDVYAVTDGQEYDVSNLVGEVDEY